MDSGLMTDVRISVIIPVYNVQKYIKKTLESIQSQTKKVFEIIVVDDGSTDQTLEIVKKYPVRIFQQKNQGPSAARNYGASQATGEWLAFLDGDDLWEPQKIEMVLNEIKSHPDVELISSNVSRGNEDDGWIPMDFHSRYNKNKPFLNQIFRRNFIATSTVVIKKTKFDEVGGFNPSLRIAEDLDLWIRLASGNVNYRIINKILTLYRAHSDSTTVDLLKTLRSTKNVLFSHRSKVGLFIFIKTIYALDIIFLRLCLRAKSYLFFFKLLFILFYETLWLPFYYFI